MVRKSVAVLAMALFVAPLAAAHARGRNATSAAKGSLVVTFSGVGGGAYRFHVPAVGGSGGGCRSAGTGYVEGDSYSWSDTFVVPPTGGTSNTPVQLTGGGLLSGTEQLGPCAGAGPAAGMCTETLVSPQPSASSDPAYPAVNVALGRLVTVGALAELVRSGPPLCGGPASLIANPVRGYSELQASVSVPRAQLLRVGDWKARFTMAGAGLYSGVALSGSCSSVADAPGVVGSPSLCSFGESYSGTIEIRVVR